VRSFSDNDVPPSADPDELQSIERSRKLRRLLLFSFGWLLALLIGAGVDALLSVRRLKMAAEQVSHRFDSRNQALSTIIISVRVYDDQFERYLLQDRLNSSRPQPSDVKKHIAEIRAAVQSFPVGVDPEGQALLSQMLRELSDEEKSFVVVLTWGTELRQRRATQFIGEQLIPWRTRVYDLSQQIASLNARELANDSLTVDTSFQALETRITRMVTLALIAGVMMSLLNGWYILRLERQGRQRYQALARSRLELEGLSARLVEAQEQERRSISRELHDEVGQSLGALLVEVGQLSKLVPLGDRAAQSQISHIKSVAENAVKTIRDIALLLRPPMLDDLGLVPALEWQAREISRRSDMEVEVHSENVPEVLDDETKVCVYRLVQEALNNAATHASAKNAKVTVAQNSGKIMVEITDDGVGFDPLRQRGMGILGMEERVRPLGGTLEIWSTPGKGTTVKAELPLHPVESPPSNTP
jgi:signal transduction histidine kinase